MTVRRLRADEATLLRTLRLRALQDAPAAFGQTYAEISTRPDAYWAEMTRSLTDPDRHAMFLAEDGTSAVGMSFGLLDQERADRAHLGGMWVASEARRRGVGRALVEAVLDWARQRGFADIVLWVTEGNAEAVALYARHGFTLTGQTRPLPSDARLIVREMGRAL